MRSAPTRLANFPISSAGWPRTSSATGSKPSFLSRATPSSVSPLKSSSICTVAPARVTSDSSSVPVSVSTDKRKTSAPHCFASRAPSRRAVRPSTEPSYASRSACTYSALPRALRSNDKASWRASVRTLRNPLVHFQCLLLSPPPGLETNPWSSPRHCMRSWIMMASMPTVTAKRRHPGKDRPDPSNSIVDDGANHRTISTGNLGAVNTEIAAESFSWPRPSSDRDGW